MWPTCLIQKKQPSSSKRLPLPSMSSHMLADKMISADPIPVGGDSRDVAVVGERNDGPHHRERTGRHVQRVYRKTEDLAGFGCCRSAGTVRCECRHSQALR